MRGLVGQRLQRLLIVCGVHQPGLEIALDLVPLDQAANGGLSFLGKFPKIARVRLAEPGFEFGLRLAMPGMDLPAIAARRAKADAFGLQQDHARAALRQMQRRRQAGITAADDAHVGAFVPRHRRAGRCGLRGSGVVALGAGRVHAVGVTLRIGKIKADLDP